MTNYSEDDVHIPIDSLHITPEMAKYVYSFAGRYCFGKTSDALRIMIKFILTRKDDFEQFVDEYRAKNREQKMGEE